MSFIKEIDAYLERNKISQSAFTMRVLFNTSSYRNLLLGKLSEGSKGRLRQFMVDYPDADGIKKTRIKSSKEERAKRRLLERKSPSRSVSRVPERIDTSRLRIVRRDPCFRCGTNGEIGCQHQPLDVWP